MSVVNVLVAKNMATIRNQALLGMSDQAHRYCLSFIENKAIETKDRDWEEPLPRRFPNPYLLYTI